MNRRDFTAGVVTGIALTSGGIILVNKVGSEATNPAELLRQIAERTLGMSGFQLSGAEYESTLEELEAMLVESVSSEPDAFSSVSTLQAALEKIMLEEIQAGIVDSINGVMMSPTEANLVRYASLLVGDSPQAASNTMQGDVATNPKFGPRATVVGQVFKEQADGHGGIWVKSETPLPEATKIEIAGEMVKTTWRSDVVTGAVYGGLLRRIISQTGKYPVALIDQDSGRRQVIGTFEVKKRPPPARTLAGSESTVFCESSSATLRGDGATSTLLIDTPCAPRSAKLLIGEASLETKLGPSGLATKMSASELNRRAKRFQLFDPITGDIVDLSDLTVKMP